MIDKFAEITLMAMLFVGLASFWVGAGVLCYYAAVTWL